MNSTSFTRVSAGNNNAWVHWLFFYLLIDLGRLQDLIPIGMLRPGMISILVLLFFVIKNGDYCFHLKEVRIIIYFFILLGSYILFARNGFYAYKTTLAFGLFIPVILSIIITTDSMARLNILIHFILVITIYVSIVSITNFGKGKGGYLADENDLALLLNTFLPLFYFLLFDKKTTFKMKIFYGSGLFLALVAVIKTSSRGGFVGLLVVAIVIWFLSKRKVISCLVLILLGIIFYNLGTQDYWQDMSTISDPKESTAQARIQSWISAWHMFLAKPWGVGGNNFQVWFPEYQTDWFKRGMWGRVAHSLWFTLLAELGVLGTFLYFSLIWLNYKSLTEMIKAAKSMKPEYQQMLSITKGLAVGMIGYFAAGSFISVLYYPYFWFMTAIIVAMKKIHNDIQDIQSINATVTG